MSTNSLLLSQLTSQDKTAQVIQRALEKHNLEGVSCNDFTLSQVLQQDKGEPCDDAHLLYFCYTKS